MRTIGTWLVACSSPAFAQEAPPPESEEAGDLPLAIPIDEPTPVRVVAPEPAASVPPRREALRAYRDQALALRTIGEVQVGTTWDYAPYGRWGPYGYHTGWHPWPRPYVLRTTTRGVFQGQNRLDVPTTLDVLGDTEGQASLDRRIRSNRTIGNVGYGIGVVGVAASVVGLIGLDDCCSQPLYPGDTEGIRRAYTWSTVSITGVAMVVGGFVGGTIPSARAHRLQYDHTATFDLDTLATEIDQHNAALASQLGLSERELERAEDRPRRRR